MGILPDLLFAVFVRDSCSLVTALLLSVLHHPRYRHGPSNPMPAFPSLSKISFIAASQSVVSWRLKTVPSMCHLPHGLTDTREFRAKKAFTNILRSAIGHLVLVDDGNIPSSRRVCFTVSNLYPLAANTSSTRRRLPMDMQHMPRPKPMPPMTHISEHHR